MTINEFWEYLTDYRIATDEELRLITSINGYNEETLNDVLYVRTGYHSIDQMEE